MAKGLEKEFYKLPKEEFEVLLRSLKENPHTIHFFTMLPQSYFFLIDETVSRKLTSLHIDQISFEKEFSSFSEFGKKQIIQSFLIDEIQSTNNIENIFSTRHDIFCLLNSMKIKDKKTISITNGYRMLLEESAPEINSFSEMRKVYDTLMKGALEKDNLPDGEFFRKSAVFINDGMKNIHHGFSPESQIKEGIQEFLSLYNNKTIDLYERLILSHFLFETVHPFYDGNGRLGRFLFTLRMFAETKSFLSFTVASSINKNKLGYYKALAQPSKEHEFGSLNEYVSEMIDILHKGNQAQIKELQNKQKRIKKASFIPELTKSEEKIAEIIMEATILSEYGISNSEIIDYAHVSKRTVISAMSKFRNAGILEETPIGKVTYHRIALVP